MNFVSLWSTILVESFTVVNPSSIGSSFEILQFQILHCINRTSLQRSIPFSVPSYSSNLSASSVWESLWRGFRNLTAWPLCYHWRVFVGLSNIRSWSNIIFSSSLWITKCSYISANSSANTFKRGTLIHEWPPTISWKYPFTTVSICRGRWTSIVFLPGL